MARKQTVPLYKLGDRVEVKYMPDWKGRIIELRGALGVGGAQVYGVRLGRKPEAIYGEFPEDLLIPLPPVTQSEAGASRKRRNGRKGSGPVDDQPRS